MRDRTILVTGGGSGIGRAVVLACAARGARVGVLDIDGRSASSVADEALTAGATDALPVSCDVSDESAVADAFTTCEKHLGAPAAVHANAGIEINHPAHLMPYEDWQRVLRINLSGLFLTCREAVRTMLRTGHGGSIVCTSSPSAFTGFSGGGNAAYGSSKGGVSALVRSLAIDYARHGIRVNAVVPGAVDTPMLLTGLRADQQTAAHEAILRDASEQIPLGRLGRPEEIAAAVTWLLSDDASYVTGSHLVCDGGLMARSANTF
ncbi:SDR family NAD(P)-dependent oxidoreductase [Kribbella sp. NPDC051586]|uniref:SDR family NAD(P)-dependent oxidoreductase n=1 Tax=Kribbella sp. NPDC051586 TaxID=3364118 RepID=UPI0037A18F8B